ncbi:NB-ARC domain-containing protein [Phormidesmis priestleyi]
MDWIEPGQRMTIVGTSGSGKTTLARQIAQKLAIPHVELDRLHWEPNWIEAPAPIFAARVSEALASDCWVVDGNYGKIRDLIWGRADTVVWLDYSFRVVMKQILQRTIRRVALQEECCNGNRETFQIAFLSRDSVILWAMQTHQKNREKYSVLLEQPEYRHLKKIKLSSPEMAQNWLESAVQFNQIKE